MFAYCNNNPVIFVDPLGYEGLVGFGIQFDVSTEHGTYGVEIVVYLDPEVVANTTNSDEEEMAISLYTYSGVSISLKEIVIAPQIVEMASQLNLEELNNMSADEILIILGALLSEYDISGSLFLIYGYDNFTSADSYSGSFSTWTFSGSKPGSMFSAGLYYSWSDTCWAVGGKGSLSTQKTSSLSPINVQFSRTYYSDPIMLN